MIHKLNFGSGKDIKQQEEGWTNADRHGADVNFDFDEFPYLFPENRFDYVLCKQVLNYLAYPDKVFAELHRICTNGAIIEIEVPHNTNKGAYNDIEVKHYFNEMSFINFFKNKQDKFSILEIILAPTWFGRYLPFKRKLAVILNGIYGKMLVRIQVKK